MPALHFYDRGPDRPWANPQLATAAIVGHTTETTTRLWVRVWTPGDYHLIVSPQPIETGARPRAKRVNGAATATLATTPPTKIPGDVYSATLTHDTDLTAVFNVQGLQAATTYYYALFADEIQPNEWELAPDPERRVFRTQDSQAERLTFGLYSCHMPYKDTGELANVQMFESFRDELEAHRAAFVLGAGDQVYTDGNKRVSIWRWLKKVKRDLPRNDKACVEIMRSWYRDIFRGYWGPPQVRRLYEQFPQYMIWDDHEIMDGWGSYKKGELANELDTLFEWQNDKENLRLANLMFEAAKLTYHEYEHSHNPETPKEVYDYPFESSGCPFFVLDMRGQRNFNRATNDKVLGAAQMRRFLDWLKSNAVRQAPVLFIVSPVPVVHLSSCIVNHADIPFLGTADDLRDEWEHDSNWHERNKILDAVFSQSEAEGQKVVFLSGDVHVAAAFRLFRPSAEGARVYQLTSSGITYAGIPPFLKFIVRASGLLGDTKARRSNSPTSFTLLHSVMAKNNFGIVQVDRSGGQAPKVMWHVYGNTGETDEVMRLKAVELE